MFLLVFRWMNTKKKQSWSNWINRKQIRLHKSSQNIHDEQNQRKKTSFEQWKYAIPSYWISQQNKMKVNRMLCLQMGKKCTKKSRVTLWEKILDFRNWCQIIAFRAFCAIALKSDSFSLSGSIAQCTTLTQRKKSFIRKKIELAITCTGSCFFIHAKRASGKRLEQ